MSEFEFREGSAEKEVESETPSENQVNQIDTGPKYSDSELEVVYDALMFEGSYTEEVTVGKRIKAVLRTRNGKDARESMMVIDKMGLNMGITVESIRALYNLAQSTISINGVDISGETLEKKIERIEVLPAAIISRLMYELTKFDVKVQQAVSHGEENF